MLKVARVAKFAWLAAALLAGSVGILVIIINNRTLTPSKLNLTSLNFPVLTGSEFSWVAAKDASRRKPGIVILKAHVVRTITDLQKVAPCLLFSSEDPLVREMLIHQAEQIITNAKTPNIPIFFMSLERIRVDTVTSNLTAQAVNVIKVQNVKLKASE